MYHPPTPPHGGLDHSKSTPLFRPPRPPPASELRPYTWTPGNFGPLFNITVTKYKVTGANVRSDRATLSFDPDLLRFALQIDENHITHIDYASIKHVDLQEVPRKELKPNETSRYPHQRDNEADCFGGPASFITLPDAEKLAEIRYGHSFELTVLLISARPGELEALKDLIASLKRDDNVEKFATHVRYDRWVHRKMVEALNNNDRQKTFAFKEFKLILSDHLNINLPEKYRDWFNEFSHSATSTMNLQKLQEFFHAFMLDSWFLANVILKGINYTAKNGLSVSQFNKFCQNVQKQEITSEKRKFLIGKRVSGKKKSKKVSSISLSEFYTMLFSRENDIFDCEKTDNMAYSLNYYWINSSHNTYLMGNQLKGASSEEAYIRTLLQGCRCIELDCIDGPNNEPIVWHKNTACTKIKLFDVLKAINRFAFVSSDHPVILSIENHLCIDQQIVMANMMTTVFKSKLVQYDLFPDDPNLPSPEALKKKIIVKNKKIQEDSLDDDDDADEPDENDEAFQNDIYATIDDVHTTDQAESSESKRFYVYINDNIDGEIYSYGQIAIQGCNLHVKEERDRLSQSKEMRQHSCNSWYFGYISRQTSEEVVKDFILTRYQQYGIDQNEAIGSFLVRRSGTPLTGFYNIVVTVWVGNGTVKHVKVKSEVNPETGRACFYLDRSQMFDSVPEFINFYHLRQDIPQSAYFRYPIPNPEHYVNKLWYKGSMERVMAEQLLLNPPVMTGKFLIRDRVSKDTGDKVGFTISFLMEKHDASGTTKHFPQHLTAKEIGPHIKINDNLKFWSLNHLVDHFTKSPITNIRDVKLTMICKDGAQFVNTTNKDNLTIELNEAYPFEDPSQSLKLLLLKGFKFHNALRIYEGGVAMYEGEMGTRKGIKIPEKIASVVKDETPFGNQLKTKIVIEKQSPTMSTTSEFFGFTTPLSTITIKFSDNKEVHQFAKLFNESATNACAGGQGAAKGLSKELSDLVVYCQAVKVPKPFTPAKIDPMTPYQMCSFTEVTVDKYAKNRVDYMNLSRFCQSQLGRMYPGWSRMDSSNYNPMMPWAYGMQLVALNFQTSDLAMQLNHGLFARNQQKGYILKPSFMRKEQYDPNNIKSFISESNPVIITIKILTGRLISLPKHWNSSGCYVTVAHHGVGPGQSEKKRSTTDKRPGISPKWYQDLQSNTMEFEVALPQLSMIQFSLYSSSNELLGQRCVPVDCIKEGYRSVILHNSYGEELELAALLVHTEVRSWELAYDKCYRQDVNDQRESELQKKATDLASVIHSNIKYRLAAQAEHLTDQQNCLEKYLTELFELKYSDNFIDALMNPLGATRL